MRLLLIDTAGPVVGVAAWCGEEAVGAASIRLAAGADGWLGPILAQFLERLGGLDRIGVAIGPGAFTGLRVGVASALGLSMSTGAPISAVSSLALRACLAPDQPSVLSLLDARKGRVYAGRFDTRGPTPIALEPERDVSPEIAVAVAAGVAVGEGAEVYKGLVLSAGHELFPGSSRCPAPFGQKLVIATPPMPANRVGPRYLRDPDVMSQKV